MCFIIVNKLERILVSLTIKVNKGKAEVSRVSQQAVPMEIPISSTVEKMEADTNGPTTFFELSADNLLEGFPPETKIPVSNETITQDQPQPIAITDIHSLSENTYIETEQLDKKPHPPPQNRLRCPECVRYTASDQDQLTRHIRKVHRGENPFQCFMCDYSTYNSTLFEEHVRIHKGIKPFKCSFCPHRNVSKKNLKRHEKIHRPDNPLKCSQCDFIARNQRAFNNHMKKFHVCDKSLTCTWCDKQCANVNALVVHTTHVKSCDTIMSDSEKCDYVTCSAYRLKMHKISEHGEELKARSDLWKCGLCEWSGNRKSRILLHLIHHPNQKVDENVIDISILKKHGIM